MIFRRILLVVLDSLGIGEMPDAAAYGDQGSDTLGNLARQRPLHLPRFAGLGLGNIKPLPGIPPSPAPQACFGRCALASPGKDTTTGHWELAGIILEKPFPLYPRGFPADLLQEFERRVGRNCLGNLPASGTEIIRKLGPEHVRTGSPIVYTSADSVFQVAAHEEVIPLPELYRICEIARDLLRGEHEVGRVIARPFLGTEGAYQRVGAHRKDYALPPPEGMLLDRLAAAGVPVTAIGKIADVYLGRGVSRSVKTANNAEGMTRILELLATEKQGLLFANLVDFDMLYGHRNDVEGYARALEAVDAWIPALQAALAPGDLVLFTADHGCDPTTPSTDHSREYVPLLAWGPQVRPGRDLGARASLADIGQTIARNFNLSIAKGTHFLEELL